MQATASRGSMFARAYALVSRPAATWSGIAVEDSTTTAIFRGYVLPMALIGPLCGFIGGQIFGVRVYGSLGQPGVLSQLTGAAVALGLTLISYVVLCAIAETLSPRFGGHTGSIAATKLIAYSLTPVWLVGVISLVPMLAPLTVLGLYSVYLVYRGVGPIMGVPDGKAAPYTLALVLCGLVLNFAVFVLSASNMAIIRGMGLLN